MPSSNRLEIGEVFFDNRKQNLNGEIPLRITYNTTQKCIGKIAIHFLTIHLGQPLGQLFANELCIKGENDSITAISLALKLFRRAENVLLSDTLLIINLLPEMVLMG